MNVCPYMEYALQILGRKWNGLILHYLSLCENGSSHFSELKRDLPNITPKALSSKLSELLEHALIVKKVSGGTPVSISYELTEKGRTLVASFQPLQTWAQSYVNTDS
ncbi:winged helix-turn-helix transcriptional regulator [Paenibacillus mendelii]|uniref:Winged helix-turn-helix transcriptional regulator n=1 Tax=Paenibacillus mendelii TaxID=206163 RepID=A0ABV6J623_9BACL|nr:helix-turn-helix domain-containing protein [Paenibacillus mendelii]MCQ6559372.1 helix-turn-helix transcriptional regulator [Paenibacillus mendelii]